MIYVSGRVDIKNLDHYKAQFQSAKEYLLHDVWVYEDNIVTTLTEIYEEYAKDAPLGELSTIEEIEARIAMAKNCTRLYLLQGWEVDDMCRMEHTIAKAYGVSITYSKKF